MTEDEFISPGLPDNVTLISSEQLIKELDNTGTVATQAEKLLSEIDMKFQQLLDDLRK